MKVLGGLCSIFMLIVNSYGHADSKSYAINADLIPEISSSYEPWHHTNKAARDSLEAARTVHLLKSQIELKERESRFLWIELIAFMILLFLLLQRFVVTHQQKKLIEVEQARLGRANQKLKELDKAKSQFLADISREFRSPLTVISGMADQLRAKPNEYLEAGTDLIRRNSETLLRLVNQILSLREIDKGKVTENNTSGNVVRFVKYVFESFSLLAESKNVGLQLEMETQQLEMEYDAEKLQGIVSDIVTSCLEDQWSAGGCIALTIAQGDGRLKLIFKNTGSDLSPKDLKHVFDRIYEGNGGDGAGVDLSVTRDVVDLIGGSIAVRTKESEGVEFTVMLPVRRREKEVYEADPEADKCENESEEDKDHILIVEDHDDLVEYLCSILEDTYSISIAKDGEEGIALAIKHVPDIIISDIIMPGRDGFELLGTLKNNMRTSHIPILMLTGKTDDATKMQGLKKGADMYLVKPFNKRELEWVLNNMSETRKNTQVFFLKQVADGTLQTDSEKETETAFESHFLEKLNNHLEANLENSDFKIQELTQAMAISRSQLHNKVRALTGLKTTQYISFYKIEKAKVLLRTTDMNISEIAYSLGFSTPSYFSRVFTDMVEIAPTVFRQQSIDITGGE